MNKVKIFTRLRRMMSVIHRMESATDRLKKMMDASELPAYQNENEIKFRLDLRQDIISKDVIIILRANINGKCYSAHTRVPYIKSYGNSLNDTADALLQEVFQACFAENIHLGMVGPFRNLS